MHEQPIATATPGSRDRRCRSAALDAARAEQRPDLPRDPQRRAASCRGRVSYTDRARRRRGSRGGRWPAHAPAMADNLSAIFPEETAGGTRATRARDVPQLRARRRSTSCARCRRRPRAAEAVRRRPSRRRVLRRPARPQGSGIILVTGHFGNWEVGGVLFRTARPAADDRRDGGGRPDRQPDPARDPRPDRRRHHRGPPVARHGAADPAPARPRTASSRCWSIGTTDATACPSRCSAGAAWFLRTPFVMGHATGAPVLPLLGRAARPRPLRGPAGHADLPVADDVPRDEAIAQRRAARRGRARAAHPRASGVLVSLLPVLGRAARRLPRLVCRRERVRTAYAGDPGRRRRANSTFAKGVPSPVPLRRQRSNPRRSKSAATRRRS